MTYGQAADLLSIAMKIGSSSEGLSYAEFDTLSDAPTFEAKRRHTQRLVRALERIFGSRLETAFDERGKVVRLNSDQLLHLIQLLPGEVSALDKAVEALRASNAMVEAGNLASLKTKLEAHLPAQVRMKLEVDRDALAESAYLVVKPGPRLRLHSSHLDTITRALLSLQRLSFTYRVVPNATPEHVVLEPLGVISGHRAYLVGARTGTNEPVLWRLDRMSDVSPVLEAAKRPVGFDLQKFARRSFGVFHSEAEYGEVEWRFSAAVAERVLDFEFHPDQEMVVEADGSVTVRFWASGHLEMAWALYPWGDKVQVVKPDALRELVKGHQRSDFVGLP